MRSAAALCQSDGIAYQECAIGYAHHPSFVIAGLDPAIHAAITIRGRNGKASPGGSSVWIRGSSLRMTRPKCP